MSIARIDLSTPSVVMNGVAIASDPSVVRVNGEYLMFYTDLNYEGVATAISVARSPDGMNWTRIMAPGDPGGSVLGGSHSFETAEAVVINGELILYVAEYDESLAGGLQSSIHAYRVKSDFSVERVSSDPVISLQAGGADEDAVFSPTVFAHDGHFVMYYVGHDYFEADSTGVSLLYATSPDGVTWTKGSSPVLQAGDGPSWSAEGFAEPCVIVTSDGRVHLFYTSLHGEERAIGYAVAEGHGMPFEFSPTPFLTAADCPGNPSQILAPTGMIENGELRLWYFAYDDVTGYRIMSVAGQFPEGGTDTPIDPPLDETDPPDELSQDPAPITSKPLITEAGGTYSLVGTSDKDRLIGKTGNDRLYGGDGKDILVGGVGADLLDGGDGIDRAQYTDAKAGVRADIRSPNMNKGDALGDTYVSVENLRGSLFDDTLRGDTAENVLWGHRGNDWLIGRSGDDNLRGMNGDDTLIGGCGDDRLTGGAGSDTFEFVKDFSQDVVTDFDVSLTLDLIDLTRVGSIKDFEDLSANHLIQAGGNTIISDGKGNTITLIGVDIDDLTADSFLF